LSKHGLDIQEIVYLWPLVVCRDYNSTCKSFRSNYFFRVEKGRKSM